MGLWSVSMLLPAELLRVRLSVSGMALASSGVALAQALLVLALGRDSSPWPCRAQGQFFFASLPGSTANHLSRLSDRTPGSTGPAAIPPGRGYCFSPTGFSFSL